MSQCDFSIPIQSTAVEVAEKARLAITEAGGIFQGDAGSGNFDLTTPLGSIRGSYIIQYPLLHVTITSKPFLVSCSLIEKHLLGHFETVSK